MILFTSVTIVFRLKQFITTPVNYTCTSFINLKLEGEPSEVQIKIIKNN